MTAKGIAWISTTLLIVSIAFSVVGFRMLISTQALMTESLRALPRPNQ
jgi:hypothetical protein